MMSLGVWVVFGWMAFVGLTVVAFIVYAVKSGQLKDIEEAKYKMLDDREPEPWPGREADGKGDDK
jgi:nitrogen fixation-related uncharacterized protein